MEIKVSVFLTIVAALAWFLVVRRTTAYTIGHYQRDLKSWGPSTDRDSTEREGSCGQSEIQHNVTLRGGIHAGYFRKLAQYVAMRLCVELCCEEKGCDVAFMSGRNCYGVQCFSEDQCQSIPAKTIPPEPIFISHVTFKGEGAQKTHEPKNLQCSATRMKVGVTLRGGLKSGNFTDVGKVDSMVICTKLCCVAEKCDLAMMINQSCFLVSCYSKQLCQLIKAISTKYQPSVAYVMRKTGELQIETATKLQALHTTDSKLMCKNSQIFYNSTLRGGYKAGNFTDLGRVTNMTACVRLCCGDKNCDAAFMLEKNCYAVACVMEDLCTPVHAKKSGALIALNPKLSYITSRSEEVMSKKIVSEDGSCHAGVISYDVTLRGGMTAGNFTPHGKVDSMEACIEKCCRHADCNAAMMLKDACFTVACFKDELCEKKPIPTSSSYNPKIAYVFREKRPKKKVNKKVVPTLPQRLKQLTAHPASKHILQKHHFKYPQMNTTFSHHNKTHRVYKATVCHHCLNSTEKLTRLLNQTSYTEEEIKHVATPSSTTMLLDSKKSSLPDIVESIMPGSTNTTGRNAIADVSSINYKVANGPFGQSKVVPISQDMDETAIDGPLSLALTDLSDESKIFDRTPSQPQNPTRNQTGLFNQSTTSPNGEKSKPDDMKVDPLLSFVMEDSERSKVSEQKQEITGSGSSVLSIMPGLSLIGEDSGCTNSEIIRNVTLRGGITAGKFKDRGKMEDFGQCLKICCLSKTCDLAFMLSNNCFSVECENEELCEAVPARKASIKPPTLAYIYARSRSVAKRHAGTRERRNDNFPRGIFELSKRTVDIVKDSSPVFILKKRNAAEEWADEGTIPRLRLKIPNR
eukprot:gene12050-13293_t